MTKTIIVPVDGTDRAETAIGPADWLSTVLPADLMVVTSTFEADSASEETYLARAVARATTHTVRSEVLHGQFPATGILEAASHAPEPMVCMATHGRSRISAMMLGSVADDVVRHSDIPVMLVGPGYDGRTHDGGIVVALKDASHSLTPLPLVLEWGSSLAVPVHVVSVTRPSELNGPSDRRGIATSISALLREHGVDARAHDLIGALPADSVLSLVRSTGAQFLVIGRDPTIPKGSVLPLGRVGMQLVHDSPRPVVIQPAL